jgi:putative acetyltransferase
VEYRIVEDDLSGAEVAELHALHLSGMFELSPADKVHALPIERLRQPDVTFYSAWAGDDLAAIGAIKQLDSTSGELKSMRAAPAWRGKGAGEAILLRLLEEARARGYSWLGLETGRTPDFVPAHSLYAKHGFSECAAFADYVTDEWSVCMGRTL